MSLEISEDLIARQPPEAQAIIRLLLAKIAELEASLNQSPCNSSLPPSTEHPHARPARPKSKTARKQGGQPRHPSKNSIIGKRHGCAWNDDFLLEVLTAKGS